jgi:hypothetical protein
VRPALAFAVYVAAALALLVAAQLLIRLVSFARWRGSLGEIAPGTRADAPVPPRLAARARHIAAAVARADALLPMRTKCLARAVATQWLARLRGCPTVLAIAVHADRDRAPDPYHAWVAVAGEIVIGHCDPREYREILSFAGRSAARPGAAGG